MRSPGTAPGGMLAAAFQAEVAAYIDAHADQVDDLGHTRWWSATARLCPGVMSGVVAVLSGRLNAAP